MVRKDVSYEMIYFQISVSFSKFVIWTNMKDSPEANFPIHITISYDSKFDKFAIYIYIYIYTEIHMKNTVL